MQKNIFIITLFISQLFFGQQSKRWTGDQKYAEKQLEIALKHNADRTRMNKKLLQNKEVAVKYAELLLFEKYENEMIEFQKPYQAYMIEDYWIIFGTLPRNYKGGVFHVIFDSWNGQVKRFYHGK